MVFERDGSNSPTNTKMSVCVFNITSQKTVLHQAKFSDPATMNVTPQSQIFV